MPIWALIPAKAAPTPNSMTCFASDFSSSFPTLVPISFAAFPNCSPKFGLRASGVEKGDAFRISNPFGDKTYVN